MAGRARTVEALPGYLLRVVLDDGGAVERDLSPLVRAHPLFASLREIFGTARLLADGAVEWANGVDLAPETLLWGEGPVLDSPPPRLRIGPPDSVPDAASSLAPGELLALR